MPHDPKFKLRESPCNGVNIGHPHPRSTCSWPKHMLMKTKLLGFIQRLCGLMRPGKVTEHILPFSFGSGANGKPCLALILLLSPRSTADGRRVRGQRAYWFSPTSGRENAHPTEFLGCAAHGCRAVRSTDIGLQVR